MGKKAAEIQIFAALQDYSEELVVIACISVRGNACMLLRNA